MLRRFLALAFITVAAKASTVGPLSGSGWDASAFNVVTLVGDFAPSSDVGGRVAVAGSYTGNGYQIYSQQTSVPNTYTETYALIVQGNISTNPFTVGDGSSAQSVWVGGTFSANSFNSPKPTVVTGSTPSDFDFTAARTALDTLSTNTLGQYSGAVTATPVSNGTNLVLTATGSGLLIYNVDASFFTNQNLGFEVDAVTGQSVIVNVTGSGAVNLTLSKGTVVKYNGNTVTANTTGGVPVLFNLPNTTSLSTSNGSINGSVLAPYATFSSQNQTVDGQLFVAAVNGLAETHDQFYNGVLPPTSSTPEPASVLLTGTGLLLAGLIGGKRPGNGRLPA